MQVPLLRNSERVDFRRCLVETCDKTKIVARGLCGAHYQKWRKYGDPEFTKPRTTTFKSGEEHNNWTGNDITYSGLHRRIRSIRGSASNFNCVDCGNIASEWSHIHNTDHNDVNNYQSRCRKCHVKYDDNPPPKSKKCKLGCLCGKHGDLNYA